MSLRWILTILAAIGVVIFLMMPVSAPEPQPEITQFYGDLNECAFHKQCVTYHWQTVLAEQVSLYSGHVDEKGIFAAGGWYSEASLPPNGSASTWRNIGNDAAQLCIVDPTTGEAITCVNCIPHEAESCIR